MKLKSSSKGVIAQLECELAAHKKVYFTSKPQSDLGYDLIIDTGTKLLKTQIKYCNRKMSSSETSLELNLYNKNRPFYSDKEIDLLLVYISELDKILAYPPDKFHERKTISINLTDKTSPHHFSHYVW